MIISPFDYITVMVMIFLAGLMDSIAGGGGLISLPTYLAVGLPPHQALGTNKFSSFWGTLVATIRYFRNNIIDIPVAVVTALLALIGSWGGARTVLFIKPDFLNSILLILIPGIAVINLLRKNIGSNNKTETVKTSRKYYLCILAGLVIGFYDGFFGPGTGAFLIIFYTFFLKYDFITANANTKVVNLSSNLAAVVTFAFSGSIYFRLAIPAAVFGILGNLVGSELVILRGNRLVKTVFLIVLFLLMIRIVWNVIKN